MKALITTFFVILSAAAVGLAHGNNDHVRGVVTEIAAQSVTVQTADKKTRVLSLTSKTAFEQAKKPAHLADLKVGDRVVIDVPKGKQEALLIQFGTAPKAPAVKK